jgi:hypothetical protein
MLKPLFFENIWRMPDYAIRTFLGLLGEFQQVGVTIKSFARANGLSEIDIRRGLTWLEQPKVEAYGIAEIDYTPYIEIIKKSAYYTINVLPTYAQPSSLKFKFDDTDQTRLRTIELENKKLLSQISKPYEENGLSLNMRGHYKPFIVRMESDLGRILTHSEAFMIGSMLDMYGLERVEKQWRTMLYKSDNPIRAMYAMFKNGANGKNKWTPKNVEAAPKPTPVITREE